MTRIITVLALVTALAGCTIESQPTTPAPTTEATPATAAEPPPEIDFTDVADVARDLEPSLSAVPDSMIVDLTDAICGSFDLGLDPTAVHESSYGTGVTMTQVNAMIVASITVTCPEHYAMVEAWSEGGTL